MKLFDGFKKRKKLVDPIALPAILQDWFANCQNQYRKNYFPVICIIEKKYPVARPGV